MNKIVLIFVIKSIVGKCTLSNGVEIEASKVICRRLNKALKKVPEYTDEQKQYSCEEIGELENGLVFCTSDNSVGSVCQAFCSAGYKLNGPARKPPSSRTTKRNSRTN